MTALLFLFFAFLFQGFNDVASGLWVYSEHRHEVSHILDGAEVCRYLWCKVIQIVKPLSFTLIVGFKFFYQFSILVFSEADGEYLIVFVFWHGIPLIQTCPSRAFTLD